MNVAERIIDLRNSMSLTTNKLADMTGISQSYLREIEMGNKNPTIEIISYICEALNISLKVFFSDTDSNVNPVLLSAIEKLNEDEQLKLAEFINAIKKRNNCFAEPTFTPCNRIHCLIICKGGGTASREPHFTLTASACTR